MKAKLNIAKFTKESAKRLRAYQRNQLYPIFLALSSGNSKLLKKRIPDFIKRLNNLSVDLSFNKKDEQQYHTLVRLLQSPERLTEKKKKEAAKKIQQLIHRLRFLTHYLERNVPK